MTELSREEEPKEETKIYSGLLEYTSNGEEDEVVSLDGAFLSETLQDDIGGKIVTLKYYTSPRPIDPDTVVENFWKTFYGKLEADYCIASSEYTGYLRTNQDLMVGGHDVMAELESHIGEYLYMIVEIHN